MARLYQFLLGEILFCFINSCAYFILFFTEKISLQDLLVGLVLSNLSLLLLMKVAAQILKKRKFYSLFLALISLFLLLLHSVHFVMGHPLEIFFLVDNFSEVFSKEGLTEISKKFSWVSILSVAGVSFLIAFLSFRNKGQLKLEKPRTFFWVLWTYFMIFVFFPLKLDPLSNLVLEGVEISYESIFPKEKDSKEEYACYIRSPTDDKERRDRLKKKNSQALPHVFVIFWESLTERFSKGEHEEKGEYTPFLNSLKKSSLFLDHFYGNSIQTSRGQFATLCSSLPSHRNKIFKSYPNHDFFCLSDLLKEYGYTNLFFKAYRSVNFDNTRSFMKRHSFDHIKGMTKEFVSKKDKKYVWGWGLQDDIFYQKFFSYLDKVHRESDKKTPFFSSLTTVSGHMNFDKVPKAQRHFYQDPETVPQKYSNAIYVSDKYLKTFFKELHKREYLKNSLVVILGDHSWPLGKHGLYYNESGYYEEFYKTSALIKWKDHLKAGVVSEPSSQLDIAPTILDLIGLSPEEGFMGESLLTPKNLNRSIYQIQPYSGGYLGVVKWPFKFVHHLKSGHQFLYQLEQDQMEETNLISNFRGSGLVDEFHKELSFLKRHQRDIESNCME